MSNDRLVRPVNPKNLPPELTANLKAFITPDKYTIKDLVLCFLGQYGKATIDDLLIYVFQTRNRVTSRGYMYQLVHRLRHEGWLQPAEKSAPHSTVYVLTADGKDEAPAYVSPETGEFA